MCIRDRVKDRLNRHAASFSGGQQQRMCLARTLALEPDILLLDEPTASLDRKSAELIEEHLDRLKDRIPVIMVSHSLAPVSYTHLDVYKRQSLPSGRSAERGPPYVRGRGNVRG